MLKPIGNVDKQPEEKFPVTADFAEELAVDSDSIASFVTKVTRITEPVADSSADIKDGDPTQSGTKVIQKVKGGLSGERHRVEFEVTTAQGKKLEAEIDLWIQEV